MDSGTPNYTNDSIQAILTAIQATVNVGDTSTSVSFDLNGPTALTNIPQPHGPSSFEDAGKRKALFLSQIYNYGTPGFDKPKKRAEVLKVVDGVTAAVRGAGNGIYGSYVNYVDPRLDDWGREYYGDALGPLKRIKSAADPSNMFDFPQSLARA